MTVEFGPVRDAGFYFFGSRHEDHWTVKGLESRLGSSGGMGHCRSEQLF